MTIWEKSVLNIQKGAKKITAFAALLSERVKAEIAIVRLRIRIDDVRSQIDELHRGIGREVEALKDRKAMPEALGQLQQNEHIETSLNELGERNKELEDLKQEVANEQDAFKKMKKQVEEDAAL